MHVRMIHSCDIATPETIEIEIDGKRVERTSEFFDRIAASVITDTPDGFVKIVNDVPAKEMLKGIQEGLYVYRWEWLAAVSPVVDGFNPVHRHQIPQIAGDIRNPDTWREYIAQLCEDLIAWHDSITYTHTHEFVVRVRK